MAQHMLAEHLMSRGYRLCCADKCQPARVVAPANKRILARVHEGEPDLQAVLPLKKPPMIYLSAEGIEFATIQRFPMGCHPMRKNQPEEISQFIKDFFDHPEPGEWTKNLRYRYPLPGDPIVWLSRVILRIFGGYKKANAEDKVDTCLLTKDSM